MEDAPNLTKAQMLFWAGQKLEPHAPLYNMAVNIAFVGEVDPLRFEGAFRKVAGKCDALMSVFEEEGAMPTRKVLENPDWTFLQLDFSNQTNSEQEAHDWAEQRCRQIFTMGKLLFESALIKVRADRYIWFLNQHHLVTDAWSTSVLFRHVSAAYEDAGYEPSLPNFDDYVAFDHSARQSPEYKAVAEHWRQKSQGSAAPPRLYGNRPDDASTRTERIRVDFGQQRSERLRAIALEADVRCLTPHLTFFNLFTTFLFSFLYRVSGQTELAIGAPAHNRPTLQFKETVGVFIELFPLFAEIRAADSFQTVLDNVRAESAEFLRYARPAASDPEFNRGFNAVLNYINASFGEFAGMATETDWVHCGHGDRGHHLRLQVYDFDAAGRFVLEFDLNTDVFYEDQRRRIPAHFLRLVDAFLADRNQQVAAADLLSDAERGALLVDYNAPAEAPLPDKTVVALFEEWAARAPERDALIYGDAKTSFGDLDAWASQLAATLDVEGQFVGVCMRRSPEWVVAILAILKAGGTFIPLELSNPDERLLRIVVDSGLKLIVTARRYRPLLAALEEKATILDVDINAEQAPAAATHDPPSLDGLAYMIYTSGSTGEPKGVPIAHTGLADYISWAARTYVRGDQLTYPFFTSPGFDLTITSLFLPLTTGGTLVIYEENGEAADTSIVDVIRDNAVDFIKLTPAHLSLVGQMELPAEPRISRMVLGGEDLKTSLARRTQERFGNRLEIYNEYGPTEAVVGCMIHRFDMLEDAAPSVPIGVPADHVQIYVLDHNLLPVPMGVPGELCISRHGLSPGYHGNPSLTRERFVAHPFREGDRLYRSGDLARFSNNGSLEFLGRIDRQLKVAGHRVEAGEIEAALESHPAIDSAVVNVIDRPGVAFDTGEVHYCEKCGIPSNYPDIHFDDQDVCSICRDFESYQATAQAYFKPIEELDTVFADSKQRNRSEFDCMALLSGGKDSTYALYRLVEMGLKVYVFSLDNGYISDGAKANIRAVVNDLGVMHEFAATPAMPAIFKDSLTRFSNVCNGCFKTIYTLSVNRARELGIPIIVTGLSRGQFFETRLTPDLFRNGGFSPDQVDAAVLEARKVYHRMEDAVSCSLEVQDFQDDAVFEEVRFVDFYRYCDVSVGELMHFLASQSPWKRPSDTGRSTNCRINDLGIYIHKKERGYHNYALPYSWDVRMGHKTRQQAIDELNDDLDVSEVRRMSAEVGYDEDRLSRENNPRLLVAYYTGEEVTDTELRVHLERRLPSAVIPAGFQRIDAMPLNRNGKVDFGQLPVFDVAGGDALTGEPVEGDVELQIAEIWAAVLKIPEPPATANFFALGGASLPAMEVMLRVSQRFGISLPLAAVFQNPTIRELATLVEETVLAEIEAMSDDEAERLLESG